MFAVFSSEAPEPLNIYVVNLCQQDLDAIYTYLKFRNACMAHWCSTLNSMNSTNILWTIYSWYTLVPMIRNSKMQSVLQVLHYRIKHVELKETNEMHTL